MCVCVFVCVISTWQAPLPAAPLAPTTTTLVGGDSMDRTRSFIKSSRSRKNVTNCLHHYLHLFPHLISTHISLPISLAFISLSLSHYHPYLSPHLISIHASLHIPTPAHASLCIFTSIPVYLSQSPHIFITDVVFHHILFTTTTITLWIKITPWRKVLKSFHGWVAHANTHPWDCIDNKHIYLDFIHNIYI